MRCFPVAAPSASSRRSGSSPPHQPRPRPPLLPSRRGHRRRQGSIPAAAGAGARREGGGQPGEEGRHQRVVSVQASKLVKYLTSTGSLQGHAESLSDASVRHFSSASSSQANSTDENGFKGHGMLAPFIAGWQSNDVHPLVIERSEGSYVYDINGNKHLDSLAGLWCTALGGSEPRLVKAATDQLNKLPFYHSFWNRTTKPTLDLADDLLSMFTASKMGKAFFINSGSEANDLSMFTASKMGKAFFINSGSEANDSQQADGINLLSLLLEPAIIYIVCSLIIGKNGGGVAQEQDFGVVCCPGESRQEE